MLVAFGVMCVVLGTILPILWTDYAGDDTINRTLPAVMARDQRNPWDVFTALTTEWIRNQGRVFPGAVAYGTTVFSVFTTRIEYKSLLVLVLCATLVAFWWWLTTTTHSRMLGGAGVVVAVAAWQFRSPTWHDSITSYAGMIPYTCALIFCVGALIDPRHRRRWPLVVAAVLWVIAVMTYEVTVLLTPAVLAVLWLRPVERRARLERALAIGAPTIADLLVVGFARSRLHAPTAPGYTLNLAPGPTLKTTWAQSVAAVPLSQRWIPGALAPSSKVAAIVIVACVPFGLGAAAVIWKSSKSIRSEMRWWLLGTIGLWFWLTPAVLVGATERWQRELPTGQGYLSVTFETFGLAIVVVSLIGALGRSDAPRIRMFGNAVVLGLAAVIGIAVTANMAINIGVLLA